MRTLLLQLDFLADDALTKAAEVLASVGAVLDLRAADAAGQQLRNEPFDLVVVHGDDGAELLRVCHALSATGQTPPLLILGASPPLTTAVALIKAGAADIIVRDSDGRWTSQLVDEARAIAERQRATRSGREVAAKSPDDSTPLLAGCLDASPVAMFAIDDKHRVTHWNRACADLTGLPARDVLGTREPWRAFYPAARPCLADLVVDSDNDQLTRYYGDKKFHRARTVDGGYEAQDFFAAFGNSGRWLHFTAAPLRNGRGDIVGAIETLQDITEQKRAEESLRQSEERYRLLSITDGMTGLYNARHFALRLGEEMDRCLRYQHSLALMVMDVDNFKQFNDSWGHLQGDQVLIRLAECITACLRRSDQAFRYGGEEFVVLLPESDMEEAAAAAERLCTMFAACDISPAAGSSVRCTASIGVTTFVPGESPRDFVARADSGSYEAKRLGKNRVIRIPPVAARGRPERQPRR